MIDLVFLHSYSSSNQNWESVVLGQDGKEGRLTTAKRLAAHFQVRVIASDRSDDKNISLYKTENIANLKAADSTQEEIRSALSFDRSARWLFVSSPDHLPRVVRDVLAQGAAGSLFCASQIQFSCAGPQAVEISEPSHRKHP